MHTEFNFSDAVEKLKQDRKSNSSYPFEFFGDCILSEMQELNNWKNRGCPEMWISTKNYKEEAYVFEDHGHGYIALVTNEYVHITASLFILEENFAVWSEDNKTFLYKNVEKL